MFDIKKKDFTIHKFRNLCEAVASNYPTITMTEYFKGVHPDNFVLMRHDVDRMPGHALETAKVEKELGIVSTYYFRAINSTFKPTIMKKIEKMGHEVGYHYEDLSVANGNCEKSIELFVSNLDRFNNICNVSSICMHGRPLSRYDNRDMWKIYNFEDYGIIGEAYLSAGNELNYFSDTGRNWCSQNNLRDYINPSKLSCSAKNTDDLIELISRKERTNFYILSHPERWSLNTIYWCTYRNFDFLVNCVKKSLKVIRND